MTNNPSSRIKKEKKSKCRYPLNLLMKPYIQKFIKRFSREPLHFEDQNYIYEKGSDDKLLCKHYLYSSKIDNDEDAHITMKRLFGTLPKDGSIFCKCCGEYLCHEDFSTLEGISDDGPKNSREILNTSDDSIEEILHLLMQMQPLKLNLTKN